jgi:hypothetical protein
MSPKRSSLSTFRKRLFLNPISTSHTSYVYCEAESSRGGEYTCGNYLVVLADCHRIVRLEFLLSTKQYRRMSVKKLNSLIDVLTKFRDALEREIALIERGKSCGPAKASKP